MRVGSLHLTDFGPFASAEIPFASGLTVVCGRNGAGKSSVVEALRWLVSGRVSRCDGGRVAEDEVVRVGGDEVGVVGVFDGARVERWRRRGRATRLRVEIDDGVLSGKAAQDAVWRGVVGIGPDAYSSILHVAQGRVTALADASDAERRDVLLSWCGSEIEAWEGGADAARSDLSDSRQALVAARAQLAALDARVAAMVEPLATRPSDEIAADLNAVVDHLVNVRARLAGIESERRAYADAVAKRDGLIGDRTETIPVPDVPPWDDADELGAALDRKKTLLPVVAGSWSGGCPITRSACPAGDHVRARRDAAGTEVIQLDSRIVELESRRRAHEFARAERERVARLNAATTERTRVVAEQLAAAETALASMSQPEDPAGPVAEISGLEHTRVALHAELTAAETAAAARAERERLLAEHHAAGVAVATSERAFGLRNAVVRAIDEVAGPAAVAGLEIESRTNDLLDGTGLRIAFRWTELTKQRVSECAECGEIGTTNRATCASCGVERPLVQTPALAIDIIDGGKTRDLRFASGGQRQIVCLAARLATCPGNTIVLDEVDSALDEDMGRAAARILRRSADAGLQVIVVSHNPEVWAEADTLVTVSAGPSGSTVEVST